MIYLNHIGCGVVSILVTIPDNNEYDPGASRGTGVILNSTKLTRGQRRPLFFTAEFALRSVHTTEVAAPVV